MKFSERNRRRCESPHGFSHALSSWSLSDWATATGGEFGEAANIVKKLNRIRDGIPGNTETEAELRQELAKELADIACYLDLWAQAAGFDLETIRDAKFNEVSAKMGYVEEASLPDKPLVYLACPYSHHDRSVRVARFAAANRVAGALMKRGMLVFSPISHTHPIAECCDLPLGWEFWHAYDRAFLEHANAIYVLCINGWRESVGVQAELKIASELGLNVVYIDNDGSEEVRERAGLRTTNTTEAITMHELTKSFIGVIRIQTFPVDCWACGADATGLNLGIPVYEDFVLPNDYEGEWGGVPACRACFERQGRLASPVLLNQFMSGLDTNHEN